MTGSGGQEWMLRCRRQLPAASDASNMKGTCAKAPVQPIIITAPLELLHIDFTNIETTMELDQPPNVVNVLVFCDCFTKHDMAYMTPIILQNLFLWQGYISIFGAPAKHLSDQGANFESSIIRELCELIGIWKVMAFLTMLKPMDRWTELTKC